ncbi:MAG: OmpA family protein, partial [Alphaproteobacteria bacterium]|nr:OmpA family protein [Alphaproteobacteria bacterium]
EAAPLPAPTVTSSTSDSDHPVVKGTWPAGIAKSLVVDLDGVKHKLGTDFDLLSDAAGNWTLKPAKPVVNGTYDVVATVSDGAGKSVSDTTKNELTVNVAAPKPAPATGTYDCEGTLARIAAVFPVRFDTAKWNLVTPFDAAVNQYVALLKDPRCAAMKVQVTGHADERGSEAYNMGLSENRAKTVIDALVKAGVDGLRMNAVGMGKTKPLDPSHTPDALRKNRRVEFTVAK